MTRSSDDGDSRAHIIIEKYIMMNKLHRAYLERELNRSGVYRSQHQLLMYISKYPNASQKDIADFHHVSTATVAVSLKKLEKGGYICRETDQEDNRFNKICITEKGRGIVEDSKKVFERMEQALFNSFSEEEMLQFEGLVDRLRLNLETLIQEASCMKRPAEVKQKQDADRTE